MGGGPIRGGVTGANPTHPELLEWLACDFVAGGQRLKPLVKEIIHKAEEKGLLLLSCGTYDNTLRWIPPLNVTSEQINDGLRIFGEAVRETSA